MFLGVGNGVKAYGSTLRNLSKEHNWRHKLLSDPVGVDEPSYLGNTWYGALDIYIARDTHSA